MIYMSMLVSAVIVNIKYHKYVSVTELGMSETYDYENGAIATTRFECKQSERIVEFTVFPVEGSYNGMCKARTYELEIDAPQRPSEVLVNNVPIMDWQYGDDHKVRFSLHQENNELIKAMLR